MWTGLSEPANKKRCCRTFRIFERHRQNTTGLIAHMVYNFSTVVSRTFQPKQKVVGAEWRCDNKNLDRFVSSSLAWWIFTYEISTPIQLQSPQLQAFIDVCSNENHIYNT